jgi:hypothetical protein
MRVLQVLAKVIRAEELLRQATFAKSVGVYEVLNMQFFAGRGIKYRTTIETRVAGTKVIESGFRVSKSGA